MSEHDVDAFRLKQLSIDEPSITSKLEDHGDAHDRLTDGQDDKLEPNWVVLDTTDAKNSQPVSSPSFRSQSRSRSVDGSAAPLTMDQRIELVKVHEQERLARLASDFDRQFDRYYPPCHFSNIKARSRTKRQMMEKSSAFCSTRRSKCSVAGTERIRSAPSNWYYATFATIFE